MRRMGPQEWSETVDSEDSILRKQNAVSVVSFFWCVLLLFLFF
jgi:hypothetical protein